MAAESSSSHAIIQAAAQVLTWALVVLGWLIVHRLAEKRDKCKEARERLDRYCEALHAIEERAIGYHQSPTHKSDIARALLFDIQRALKKLRHHPFCDWDIDDKKLIAFRKAITLRNFDANRFAPQPTNSRILTEIANSVEDIEDMLEFEYARIYR